jgi:hypothetical protein
MSEESVTEELQALFEADQAERQGIGGTLQKDWPAIAERDKARRQRAEALIQADALRTGADFYYVAMLLQHSDQLDDYWRAHEFAKKATELGDMRGRWLAAAAYDRWLMAQKKPQKYGTQYQFVDGQYSLWTVDPSTTDEERAAWDVPTLAISERIGQQLASQADPTDAFLEDPPLAALNVHGLRVEIKRWLGPRPPPNLPKPRPVPLSAHEGMRPGFLPPGLTACKVNGGFCATDAAGEVVASWWLVPLKRGAFVSGWFDEHGPPPTLEATAFAGHVGVWIGATDETPQQLVMRANEANCWVLHGQLSRGTLQQLAAALPVPAG